MNLFEIPIKTIKWYEKLLLPFAKTYITCDVSSEKNVFCKSKKMFGKLYFIELWEEKPKVKVNGLTFDFFFIDEINNF